jgi:hypothetical protein
MDMAAMQPWALSTGPMRPILEAKGGNHPANPRRFPMTSQTLTPDASFPVRPLSAGPGAAFVRAMRRLSGGSQAARCAAEAERLFALSDAELARRGLSRDRVLSHAFARFLHL